MSGSSGSNRTGRESVEVAVGVCERWWLLLGGQLDCSRESATGEDCCVRWNLASGFFGQSLGCSVGGAAM